MLRNFCEGLGVVYYSLTNYVFIVLMFIISIALVNTLSFNSSLNATSIVFPIVSISVILLFCGNIDNFSFKRIFPICGDSAYNTFILGLRNIGAFGGVCYIYFLPPMLKEPKKFKKNCYYIRYFYRGIYIIVCSNFTFNVFFFCNNR